MTSHTAVDSAAAPAIRADTVIQLDGVSVEYHIPLTAGSGTLKEALVHWRWRRYLTHLALDSVDLSIARGEAIGIIGANGAGKTTLLKVIARVLHPTRGRLRLQGRVIALIDLLGAFDQELTGRENIYLNASMSGMSHREIAKRIDSITDFADIGAFIEAPMRSYSSGMTLRLAFAVATSVDGDILVIDEALGVGDAAFQVKCAARLEEFRRRGVTFIIVSHDLGRLATLCDRVIWLDKGKVRASGAPDEVIAEYLRRE